MGRRGWVLGYAFVALVVVGAAAHGADWLAAGERRSSFDTGWRFQKGDSPAAATPAFDDARWRVLDLPHDWAIEGPFDPAISPHQGSLPFFGMAWYRKRFEVPESARGRYYALEIDGAMSNATVYLNGQELGGRPYGYIGFAVDLTPHLRFGASSVLDDRASEQIVPSRRGSAARGRRGAGVRPELGPSWADARLEWDEHLQVVGVSLAGPASGTRPSCPASAPAPARQRDRLSRRRRLTPQRSSRAQTDPPRRDSGRTPHRQG